MSARAPPTQSAPNPWPTRPAGPRSTPTAKAWPPRSGLTACASTSLTRTDQHLTRRRARRRARPRHLHRPGCEIPADPVAAGADRLLLPRRPGTSPARHSAQAARPRPAPAAKRRSQRDPRFAKAGLSRTTRGGIGAFASGAYEHSGLGPSTALAAGRSYARRIRGRDRIRRASWWPDPAAS